MKNDMLKDMKDRLLKTEIFVYIAGLIFFAASILRARGSISLWQSYLFVIVSFIFIILFILSEISRLPRAYLYFPFLLISFFLIIALFSSVYQEIGQDEEIGGTKK